VEPSQQYPHRGDVLVGAQPVTKVRGEARCWRLRSSAARGRGFGAGSLPTTRIS
jgi:hypothetical protein